MLEQNRHLGVRFKCSPFPLCTVKRKTNVRNTTPCPNYISPGVPSKKTREENLKKKKCGDSLGFFK